MRFAAAATLSYLHDIWSNPPPATRLQGVDPREGLPKLRKDWVARREARGDVAPTQMNYARAGVVTEEMAFAAAREGLDPEIVRSEVSG